MDFIMSYDEKMTILVVDDRPANIHLLAGILSPVYRVKAATSGEKAISIAEGALKPDLILLDIMMPIMDGYTVCRYLKNNPKTANIPIIFVTGKSETVDEEKGFKMGAVDYITKPISPSIVIARVKTHLALYSQQCELEKEVKIRTKILAKNQLDIINCLGRAAEYKDNETGMHVVRMSKYSKLIAEAYGANSKWCDLLCNAAPMHDIGKIGIPDHILCKPGKFDADEWQEMQRHAEYGLKILGGNNSDLLELAREIAITHHEKWDGSGYPNGLSGTEIPLSGRIVALADVFDALTNERPYKKAWSVEDACKFIEDQSGKHFDPQLVPIFIKIIPKLLDIRASFSDGNDFIKG